MARVSPRENLAGSDKQEEIKNMVELRWPQLATLQIRAMQDQGVLKDVEA